MPGFWAMFPSQCSQCPTRPILPRFFAMYSRATHLKTTSRHCRERALHILKTTYRSVGRSVGTFSSIQQVLFGGHSRGDQKVLQFGIMYKWHRQNSYIIFQCRPNLPLHQYPSESCQKVFFYSSQIEFLGHVVEIRLSCLLELIVIVKPRSAKVRLHMSR